LTYYFLLFIFNPSRSKFLSLPEKFTEYKRIGGEMGFKGVASRPFARSVFHAWGMFEMNL